MPYKLVIADDEKKIREGLAQYIDWESLGFDVVAELEDGRDLISYLEENDVDVILTDIRMNEVSGLQVAEYVHTKKRDIKVVIISGFADFDYARQAIEYGVKKYLIKPTDMDEVNTVFAELKQELDANYAQKEAVVSEKVFLDEIKPLLSKQFFVNVMMGAFRDKSELLAKAKFLRQNIDLTDSVCGVVALLFKDSLDENNRARLNLDIAIQNFLSLSVENVQFISVISTRSFMRFAFIFNENIPIKDAREGLQRKLQRTQKDIEISCGINAEISVEKIYRNVCEMAEKYHKSISLVNMDQENESQTEKSIDMRWIYEQQNLLASYIGEGDSQLIYNLFDSLAEEIRHADIELARNTLLKLFAFCDNKTKSMGIQTPVYSDKDYSEILDAHSVDEMIALSKTMLRKIVESAGNDQSSVDNSVNNVKYYIENNYGKNISLEMIAKEFYINPAYLSRIFKEKMGESFTDYLFKVRMEKAIVYLNNPNAKVYEICGQVGYKTARYFYKQFKEYTGYTPTEYRKRVLKMNGKNYEE